MDVSYMDAYGKNVTTITVNGNIYNLAKYIHSKNAFKTVLARLEAEIIKFMCFGHFFFGFRLNLGLNNLKFCKKLFH